MAYRLRFAFYDHKDPVDAIIQIYLKRERDRTRLRTFNELLTGSPVDVLKTVCCTMKVQLTLKVAYEFIGTFILGFGFEVARKVDAEYTNSQILIGKAVSASAAVAVVVLKTGFFSHAHLDIVNTFAQLLSGLISYDYMLFYMAAQSLGLVCASFTFKIITHPFLCGGVNVPTISNDCAIILEIVITFTFLFAITSVAFDLKSKSRKLAGVATGGALFLNIWMAEPLNYQWIWISFVIPIVRLINSEELARIWFDGARIHCEEIWSIWISFVARIMRKTSGEAKRANSI